LASGDATVVTAFFSTTLTGVGTESDFAGADDGAVTGATGEVLGVVGARWRWIRNRIGV